MGNQSQKRFIQYLGQSLVFILIASSIAIPFSNCSQNPQGSNVPSTAFMSEPERVQNLRNEFSGKVSASFCSSHESIFCTLKSYSADVPYQSANLGRKCLQLSDGTELCTVMQGLYFNSAAAQEKCENCNESFEYSEYTCQLNLPNAENVYPIYFTDSSHQQAVQKIYDFCQSLTKE